MDPSQIPRQQSARVALYQKQFGKFDSGKNAYWSLRQGRPVTLAEGARFDGEMRAGRLAKVGVGLRVARGGATGGSIFRRYDPVASGKKLIALERARMMGPPPMGRGMRTHLFRPAMPVSRWKAPPQEKLLHMPTEARRIDALPATPPPGPARPPAEPLWQAMMRQLTEKRAGPATRTVTAPASFARPARPFAAAAVPMMAGFNMKKLALPLALIAGAFVVSKLV